MRGVCLRLYRFFSVVSCLVLTSCGGGGGGGGNNSGGNADTTGPFVVAVSAIDPDGAYGLGDQISLSATFSEPVYVTGVPRLLLQNGIQAQASYVSGSGTNWLTFVFIVLPGDSSADLEYYTSTQLILSSATIRDAAGNDASTELPSVGSAGSLATNSNIVVDGVRPFPLDVYAQSPSGTYVTGDTITLSVVFSEPVIVTGVPQLRLETGVTDGVATYVGGSSTNTLVFEYLVQNNHLSTHLTYSGSDALLVTTADIKDGVENAAQYYLPMDFSYRYIPLLPPSWSSLYEDSLLQINYP